MTAGSEGLQLLVLMKNLVCQRYASRRGHAATHPRSPKARTCCCTSWMRFSSCFCRRTARASASDARSASARAAFSSCSRRSWSLNACESCAAPDDARFSASSTRACMCLQRCGTEGGWRQYTQRQTQPSHHALQLVVEVLAVHDQLLALGRYVCQLRRQILVARRQPIPVFRKLFQRPSELVLHALWCGARHSALAGGTTGANACGEQPVPAVRRDAAEPAPRWWLRVP